MEDRPSREADFREESFRVLRDAVEQRFCYWQSGGLLQYPEFDSDEELFEYEKARAEESYRQGLQELTDRGSSGGWSPNEEDIRIHLQSLTAEYLHVVAAARGDYVIDSEFLPAAGLADFDAYMASVVSTARLQKWQLALSRWNLDETDE